MKTFPLLVSMLVLLGSGAVGCAAARTPMHPEERADASMHITVIPLHYAVAGELADALTRLRPDARIVPDQRTNSLLVSCASEAELKRLSDCIAALDVEVKNVVKDAR